MLQNGNDAILITDEVGIGKTAQVLGVICMVANSGLENRPVPTFAKCIHSLHACHSSATGGGPLESTPHIIISTTTLQQIWLSEAHMWCTGFEFFEYTGRYKK
ncbi:hypothetical protein SCP_0202240 [Sparassis crispa]|uniref:SNF2 N-terminal domain-containing protein n=1 Tax=Sparassis crispa TaxID=139825 RepID=A0A401GA53_9APHY|nr:hypothetical protein SCP_0202240 [Sparassis crispa]GBE79027.1 hypothetical protein SCP_0202240 [Sparassis crispa]